MKKRTTALTLSTVLSVLLPLTAYAVPMGWTDLADEYPYVGFAIPGSSFGSGVLIGPDVVLTAGHVAQQFAPAGLNMFGTGNDASNPESFVGIASSIVHPLYDPSASLFDFGLLFLDEPIALSAYATLWPSAPTTLLGMNAEVVGYGGTATRRVGDASVDLIVGSLLVSEPFHGSAVVEPGDSGGGLFVNIDGQNVLAGTSVFISGGYAAFEAVSEARSFIDDYVPNARWYGESVVSVPEPSTLVLLALGLIGIALGRVRSTSARLPSNA